MLWQTRLPPALVHKAFFVEQCRQKAGERCGFALTETQTHSIIYFLDFYPMSTEAS
jgi:hypothetical protein